MDNIDDIPITFPATIANLQRRSEFAEGQRPRQGGPDGLSVKRDKYQLKTCLSDTGAISSDYIALTLVKKLVKKYDNVIISNTNVHVKSPFKNAKPICCLGRVELPIIIFNELTNSEEIITIDALIIDSDYEIIIGRPTIRRNGLLVKCHNQILFGTREEMILDDSVTSETYKKADRWILNHLVNAAYDVKDVKGNSIEYPYATNAQKPPTHRQCVGCQETRKIHSTQGTVCKVEATVDTSEQLFLINN